MGEAILDRLNFVLLCNPQLSSLAFLFSFQMKNLVLSEHSMNCVDLCISDQVGVDGMQASDSPVYFRQRGSGSVAAHRHIFTLCHQHAAVAHADLW